jgi:hypothetical protein
LYAISDVHGGYERLVALLGRYGLIGSVATTPTAATWGGGHATLVVVGDMIDKGPQSIEVLDFLIALQGSAKVAGGQVIVTVGNHEAEFLYDPANDKAEKSDGVRAEMQRLAIDPIAIASGAEPRGRWLRNLPFAIRVGRWFFAHAANTAGRSIPRARSGLSKRSRSAP